MSIEAPAPFLGRASMSAKVYRVAWDRRPFFIPKSFWLTLKKWKVPGTYRMEDLGEIASSDDGTVQASLA